VSPQITEQVNEQVQVAGKSGIITDKIYCLICVWLVYMWNGKETTKIQLEKQ
jgi:hypothetical protein